ncbi:transglutaminase domain-containing protein [Pseudalkalibacillus decolorationis]|uniref:transglutaminase domain-containing protein n=1 Tax=Pseudalkalibacillus decolorationis TaxID=163879 RepID=UPI002148F528|nr:transglutaminase-like domain-containing protein [Pseudalkalibacillus decolorationis]
MQTKFQAALLALLFLLTTACTSGNADSDKEKEGPKDEHSVLADEQSQDEDRKEIELEDYAEEVGATLSSPKYQSFSANSSFKVEGKVEEYQEFASDYVWIQIRSEEEGLGGSDEFEYYTPLKDGKFEQEVQLFNGKGKYSVNISLPSDSDEGYFYDLAQFEVTNVNPKIKRDVQMSRYGIENELELSPSIKGYFEGESFFTLNGTVKDAGAIMVRLEKENQSSQIMIPVESGKFSKKIPLYYGEGIHTATIMTPDASRDNYYNEAASILIDNKSSETFEPIKYSEAYKERGYTLESPIAGGEEAKLSYQIKGEIDPDAPFAERTEIVLVGIKKGDLTATYNIPVENYQFDGEFFLRFGPGEYEISIYAPDFKGSDGNFMRYNGLANFNLLNTAKEDKRYLLPSQGVQSQHPRIQSLAKELTTGITDEKEKAKAIYEYVAKNVTYDVEKLNNESFRFDDSALKTLKKRTGVCQDYAYLAMALLRANGMEARMVTGSAVFSTQPHAWVETKVGGKWLTMDPTWGSGYLQDGKFIKEFTMKYFDPDPVEFDKTHNKEEIEY